MRRPSGTLLFTLLVPVGATGQITLPVQPPIRFAIYDVRSRYAPGAPQLALTLRSERQYPTLQYRFEATTTIADTVITVSIARVINDGPIQQHAVGPASYTTALNAAPGAYHLVIRADTLADEYRVWIGSDVVDVVGKGGALTIPPLRIYRLPPRAAYLHCTPAGFSMALCEDFLKLVAARLGIRAVPSLGPIERNPFRYPLPRGSGPDPYPQMLLDDISDEHAAQVLTMVRAFTDLFRYAQYRVSVVIWRANGPGYTCFDGICHVQN